ncbi:P22 phage major capsid protein family protein [Streptomyces sp. NPDC098789]|uniref:P22 phage major capsid protein family protein n=1 Tax=Streptomyces sp. NPDC098789 TaxID=3366098 RepID=UPI00380B3F15
MQTTNNTFGTESRIAETGVTYLAQAGVLAPLVFRKAETSFGGGSGTKVTIPVPQRIEAKDFKGTDEKSAASERLVTLEITESPYSSVPITQQEATLDIRDFAVQVFGPQVDGVARALERCTAKPMNAQIAGSKESIDKAKPLDWISDAAMALPQKDVPTTNRFLAVSPEISNMLRKSPELRDADRSGDATTLRNGQIASVYGFTIVESNEIKGGAVAFVPEAFALAVMAPGVPDGVAFAQSVSKDGYAFLQTKAWDQSVHSDVSMVKAYSGSTLIDADRCVAFKAAA